MFTGGGGPSSSSSGYGKGGCADGDMAEVLAILEGTTELRRAGLRRGGGGWESGVLGGRGGGLGICRIGRLLGSPLLSLSLSLSLSSSLRRWGLGAKEEEARELWAVLCDAGRYSLLLLR